MKKILRTLAWTDGEQGTAMLMVLAVTFAGFALIAVGAK